MNTMTSQFSFARYATIFSLILAVMLGSVQAQDFATQRSMASKAWKDGEYEKCQAMYERIVSTYGKRAPMLWGPQFGLIFYKKGMSELKLASMAKRNNNLDNAAEWFEKAAVSFKTCYEKFPNGAAGMADTINTAHKAALQRWAEASMGKGEYKQAIDLYKKFLKEREQRDKILPTPGGFYLNMAICHFLMEEPKIAEGIRHFETALQNREKMKTSDNGIMAAFLALSKAVIAKKDEQAMVDFLNKNRADITLEPYQMHEFTPLFMKLAADSLESEMYVASFNLYALIPDSVEVLQDIQVRVDQLGGRRGIRDGFNIVELERLKKGADKIRKKQSDGASSDAQALTAMAYLHDHVGNQRGVYGVLEQLEFYYSNCKTREDNLFNLVRVSSIIGEIFDTEKYGSRFIKDYPESDKVESVRRMMLSSLFFGGEYEKSLEVATFMIDKLSKGTPQHDICLFVLGGSHFYLGHFEKAQPFLDQHVEEYPESKLIMHSEYFQASNLTRLQYWEKAAKLLDAFLTKYPEPGKNIYLPNALYDRANCHFSESEYPPALVLLDRLEKEYSENVVIDMAYNMKGNIFESTAKLEDAEKYYNLALDISEKRENKLVAGEALSYLVGMLGIEKRDKKPNPRIKDAVPFYDKFMKEYPNSPYKPQVVVYGMPAMKAVERTDEALENLQAVISDLAGHENQSFLEECVNAFSKAFLEKKGNTPEKLKELYYNFPGIDLANKRTLALLRIAIIGVYETEIQKAITQKDEALQSKYQSGIKILFQDLRTEFNPKELTNFVLLKVGDYLREKTSAPKQAVPYYEELLSRKDKFGEFKARLGIADVMGRSDNTADNKKALVQLDEVFKRAKDDRPTQEKSLFRMVEINAKIGDWKGCQKRAREYLKEKFTKKTALVSYLFAKSFDELKEENDALFYYSMVVARYPGYIQISAPSVHRVMEMLWDRDLPAGAMVGKGPKAIKLEMRDRQNAFSGIGLKYVNSTRRIRDTNAKITDSEKEAWDAVAALVKSYESSGEVKSAEQLKEERRKTRR